LTSLTWLRCSIPSYQSGKRSSFTIDHGPGLLQLYSIRGHSLIHSLHWQVPWGLGTYIRDVRHRLHFILQPVSPTCGSKRLLVCCLPSCLLLLLAVTQVKGSLPRQLFHQGPVFAPGCTCQQHQPCRQMPQRLCQEDWQHSGLHWKDGQHQEEPVGQEAELQACCWSASFCMCLSCHADLIRMVTQAVCWQSLLKQAQQLMSHCVCCNFS